MMEIIIDMMEITLPIFTPYLLNCKTYWFLILCSGLTSTRYKNNKNIHSNGFIIIYTTSALRGFVMSYDRG